MREVVVSGLGLLTPCGLDARSSFEALLQGRSAISAAPAAITRWLPDALAAALPPQALDALDRADQGLDRATQLAVLAAAQAWADAALPPQAPEGERSGVYCGIGLAGAQTLENLYTTFYQRLYEPQTQGNRNPVMMHPLTVPRLMANATAAALSMRYRLQGPSLTYSVACASSAVALGEAWRAVASGVLDAALVVGTEAQLNVGASLGWNALRVMAAPDAQDPSRSCRPFDVRRSGFVLGEGAAALWLETRQAAQARGLRPYGSICGYGCTSDASHLTAPNVQGQARAMRQALETAGLQAQHIGYINAHGTATDVGDVSEAQAIAEVFGAHTAQLPVSATKSMHAHLIGAAGATEFAITLLALRSGNLPPTAHLDEIDPRCAALDHVRTARCGCSVDYAMSNSFAFGGTNVALVARREGAAMGPLCA